MRAHVPLVLAFTAAACIPAAPTQPTGPRRAPPPRVASNDGTPAIAARPSAAGPAAAVDLEPLIERYAGMGYPQLEAGLARRSFVERVGFDVTQARYHGEVAKALKLTAAERELLAKNGFVSVDHDQRYSFASSYEAIYTLDLPVLITTDSILNALHRSYDALLEDLEVQYFVPLIAEALEQAHERLRARVASASERGAPYVSDVDLYLATARSLLAAPGAGTGTGTGTGTGAGTGAGAGGGQVGSVTGGDAQVAALLERTAGLDPHARVAIYGGERWVDFSQFKPRGHYTRSPALERYFRAMMWLGRADTGFFLRADRQAELDVDPERELRAAMLLSQLLAESGGLAKLQRVDRMLQFLVGRSDNLPPWALLDAMAQLHVEGPAQLTSSGQSGALIDRLLRSGAARQRIRSQWLVSDDGAPPVENPPLVQVFGQRYVIDSHLLANLVFDRIDHDGEKVRRLMPTGPDVMAALGNDSAVRLLEPELERWHYSPNLLAARSFVAAHGEKFWSESFYNVWLDALRVLDDDMTGERYFPQAMRTHAWQLKQLQAQLASYAELRHDTVLYAKQSYSGYPSCEYPAGYVEPYPAFYGKLGQLARDGLARLRESGFDMPAAQRYFERSAEIMARLEQLAQRELKGQPFTAEQQAFLKKTVDIRGGGSGLPRYDGWYLDLLLRGGHDGVPWKPSIADVHTGLTPTLQPIALELGVGDANFLVAAIDNGTDRMVYVGPSYSYYELQVPAEQRLTDEQWQERLLSDPPPERPPWTRAFQPKAETRTPLY